MYAIRWAGQQRDDVAHVAPGDEIGRALPSSPDSPGTHKHEDLRKTEILNMRNDRRVDARTVDRLGW